MMGCGASLPADAVFEPIDAFAPAGKDAPAAAPDGGIESARSGVASGGWLREG